MSLVQRGPKVTSLVARSSRGRCVQQLSDTRMWRAHPAWIWRICHANVTRTCKCTSCKCCAHLRTKDVTFGSLSVTCTCRNIPTEPIKLCRLKTVFHRKVNTKIVLAGPNSRRLLKGTNSASNQFWSSSWGVSVCKKRFPKVALLIWWGPPGTT
jgi:hypothetical protein